jgi:hypothetical protein
MCPEGTWNGIRKLEQAQEGDTGNLPNPQQDGMQV